MSQHLNAVEGKTFESILDRAARSPLRTVSIEDDEEFRSLVAHCLKSREETLGEFVSRTGLGKATILDQHMTPAQITAFCELADARHADDVIEQAEAWHRRVTIPKSFTI